MVQLFVPFGPASVSRPSAPSIVPVPAQELIVKRLALGPPVRAALLTLARVSLSESTRSELLERVKEAALAVSWTVLAPPPPSRTFWPPPPLTVSLPRPPNTVSSPRPPSR